MERLLRECFAAALLAFGLAASASPAGATPPDARRALELSQQAIGRPVGDFVLRDVAGRPVSLDQYRGKPLLVSFVYTGCFHACPPATQFLMQSVRAARDALGASSFHVATIGFNVPHDSPESMADFARRHRIVDPQWALLAPQAADVDELTRRFGFVYSASPAGFDHITQVTVVDANGLIYRQVYGVEFELPFLVGPLKELLSGEAGARMTLADIWTKVKLYCTVYDPHTGGYKLNYALFFEIFAGMTVLLGVGGYVLRERWRSSQRLASR